MSGKSLTINLWQHHAITTSKLRGIEGSAFFEQGSDVPAKKLKKSESEVALIPLNLVNFTPKMISSPLSPSNFPLITFSDAF